MRHSHENVKLPAGSAGTIAVVIIVFVLAFLALLWVLHRRRIASDGLTGGERERLPFPHREILSMLRQHGSPITQAQIADTIPVRPGELAEALKDLEQEGLVTRQWDKEKDTYSVTAP
ncbi:MAG: MarR family transcriptional regulator [Candidatus Hydrogenedentota bacterium]